MSEMEMQARVKAALQVKSERRGLPVAREEALFTQVNELLAHRREKIWDRLMARTNFVRSVQPMKGWPRAAWDWMGSLIRLPILAPIAILIAVIIGGLFGQPVSAHSRYTDIHLPDYPKFNDGPAHYDAMVEQERNEYEEEIADANQFDEKLE